MATTTCYLIVEPTWRLGYGTEPRLTGMTVNRAVKNQPHTFKGVAVKLTLNIPDEAFKPLRPEVTIDVPAEALDYTPSVSIAFPEEEQ